MAQRWNDLLFAHWPVKAETMQALLPAGLEVDTFEGWAWVGVVPFWMDRVRTRVAGQAALGMPGARAFPELNVRTYVRSRVTGLAGVYFFSLDAGSALAVLGARVLFHLPYYLAKMRRETRPDGVVRYESSRRLVKRSARFSGEYLGLGRVETGRSLPGSIEYFLTERYCLFTPFGGRMLVGHIHHLPWPLEKAEAEFRVNEVAGAHGIVLPQRKPVLHFARELEVYIWPLEVDGEGTRPYDLRTGSSGG